MAAAFAAIGVPLWLAVYSGWIPVAPRISLGWHMHEMIFGFCGGGDCRLPVHGSAQLDQFADPARPAPGGLVRSVDRWTRGDADG
ncbi:NnrS family protein [Undibacterium arcticum]